MSSPNVLIPTEPTLAPDRRVVAEIVVRVYADETMSIHGPMQDPTWMLAALEHAKDAVRGQVKRRAEIVIPAKDITLPEIPLERQR